MAMGGIDLGGKAFARYVAWTANGPVLVGAPGDLFAVETP